MDHLEASNLLPQRVSGDLAPNRRKALDEHVAHCEECSTWIATYGFFAEALGDPREASSAEHLSSHELSTLALAGDGLDPAAREPCERHLRICSACLEEFELVRSGTFAAREESEPSQNSPSRSRRSFAFQAGLAIAATLLLVVGAVFIGKARHLTPGEYSLSGETIGGSRTIQAQQSIFLESTALQPGADVTLQSQIVAFGDGFSVASGASLRVLRVLVEDSDNQN